MSQKTCLERGILTKGVAVFSEKANKIESLISVFEIGYKTKLPRCGRAILTLHLRGATGSQCFVH